MKSKPTAPAAITVNPKLLRRQILAAKAEAERTAEIAHEAKARLKKMKKAFKQAKKAAKQARKELKALVAQQKPAAPRKTRKLRPAKGPKLVLRGGSAAAATNDVATPTGAIPAPPSPAIEAGGQGETNTG